jgi:GAF domain-containing protein
MTLDWQVTVRNPERLAALERSGLVGMAPDDAFDRLIELAVEVTGAPRGVIALVDADRTSAISALGFPEGLELSAPITHSFCRYVVSTARPFIVEDAPHDPRTVGDPAIKAFGATAWLGFPIQDAEGIVLGTICLMDSTAREWTSRDVQVLATLAMAVSTEVALRRLRTEMAAGLDAAHNADTPTAT